MGHMGTDQRVAEAVHETGGKIKKKENGHLSKAGHS